MNVSSTVRVKDGPLPVTVIAGGKPFASIDLTDLVDIRLHGVADCDRLMVAAATAKRMLEMGGHPHGFERGAGMYGDACAHCGQQGKNPVHVAPCGDVAGHARVTCDLAAGHEGRHEHRPQGRTGIVWGPGVDEPAAPGRVGVPEVMPIPASHYCDSGNCEVCGDGTGDGEPAAEPGLTFHEPPPLSRDLSGDLMASPLPAPKTCGECGQPLADHAVDAGGHYDDCPDVAAAPQTAAGDDDVICATPGCGHRDRHHFGSPNSVGRRGCTGDFVDHGCKCGDFTYPAPETADPAYPDVSGGGVPYPSEAVESVRRSQEATS